MGRREDIGFKVAVFALFLLGMPRRDIAALYKVTKQRISQVIIEMGKGFE